MDTNMSPWGDIFCMSQNRRNLFYDLKKKKKYGKNETKRNGNMKISIAHRYYHTC